MKFIINEWLRSYNKINALVRLLIDSRCTFDKDGNRIPPKEKLGRIERGNLERKIKKLIEDISYYMDKCELRMPIPLWNYDRDNKETHASSLDFKYNHLLPKGKYGRK